MFASKTSIQTHKHTLSWATVQPQQTRGTWRARCRTEPELCFGLKESRRFPLTVFSGNLLISKPLSHTRMIVLLLPLSAVNQPAEINRRVQLCSINLLGSVQRRFLPLCLVLGRSGRKITPNTVQC